MPQTKLRVLQPKKTTVDHIDNTISAARSHDLVFAVVGYAGSGATHVATQLVEQLKASEFAALRVRVSELLQRAKSSLPPEEANEFASIPTEGLSRASRLQDLGDALREAHGGMICAGLAVEEISAQRSAAPDEKARAFVIDSLKHPAEVNALRRVYGSGFYLISVVCHAQTRAKRLNMKFKGADRDALSAFARRDEEDGKTKLGQSVRKTLHLGDFFVANERNFDGEAGELADDLERFVALITGTRLVRPRRDERGMHAAWGAALRSACLSRQVGAAVMSPTGEILSTGTNDVPKGDGGLYTSDLNDDDDHRCFQKNKYCSNDRTKNEIFAGAFESLKEAGVLSVDADALGVRGALESTRLRDLIEFSRAVHAEMDAIIQLARLGLGRTQGAKLYSTTYPCHNCARHIVASGIDEVIYIEPYPKSMASDLHGDSISESVDREDGKVHFRLFSGVAPRRFRSLFEQHGDLKDRSGQLAIGAVTPATHVDEVFMKSFQDLEKDVANRVSALRPEGADAKG